MNYEQKINDIVKNATCITVYKNGQKSEYSKNAKEFKPILANILNKFEDCRIMPAFGVSLHNETLNALKEDCWVEIKFDSVQAMNDLPFSSLLFRLDDCYGINLIRGHNNEYAGRCIYLEFFLKQNLKDILSI